FIASLLLSTSLPPSYSLSLHVALPISVFPAADTMVTDGGTASYAIDQHDLGRTAGHMAAKVIHGKKPANYPVEYVVKGKYVINQKQVDKLNIQIPEKIMQQAHKNGRVIK